MYSDNMGSGFNHNVSSILQGTIFISDKIKCDICESFRPHERIASGSYRIDHKLVGINYCNDDEECIVSAQEKILKQEQK